MRAKRILPFSLAFSIIILAGVNTAYGQDLNKTYKWNYNVDAGTELILENYDADIDIHVWDKPEIEFHMIITAEFRNKEDVDDIDSYLRDLEFESTGGKTRINTRFWNNRTNIFGVSTMILDGLKTIRYKKFKMECMVWMPADASIDLKSKYSDITMDDIGGSLKLDLYNDELYAGSVSGDASIKAKYSEMSFTGMKDINADLYNCELSTGDAGNMKLITKYSGIETLDAGTLDIDSYEDEFIFNSCSDMRFIAKYSELSTGQAGKLIADTYECEFKADKISKAKITSKYSEFTISDAGTILFESAYEDRLDSDNTLSLNISESKYSDYYIGKLENSLLAKETYENEIIIDELGEGIDKFIADGKYNDIKLGVPSSLNCRIKASIRYPELDISEELFRTKIMIKDGSDLEYEGIKGTEKDDMTELVISGYEISLSVKSY